MTTMLIAVADLMFQPRITEAARALGVETCLADTPQAALDAIAAGGVDAMVLDLHISGDATALVRDATLRGVRVLAFGRHTEPATLRAAREAGAGAVVPRSQLVEELAELLRDLVGGEAPSPGC